MIHICCFRVLTSRHYVAGVHGWLVTGDLPKRLRLARNWTPKGLYFIMEGNTDAKSTASFLQEDSSSASPTGSAYPNMSDCGNVTNCTTVEYDSHPSMLLPEAYVVPILFGVIFVVGLVGNGTLIYTVIRNREMRTVPNIFIVSLALGDLLLILVSVPFTATIYTFSSWPYGEFVCKLNEFLQTLSLGVSVFTLTALSSDRYTVIVFPMRVHQESATRRTIAVAVGIWALACVLAIPDVVTSHITWNYCEVYPVAATWYIAARVIGHLCIYFILPVTIIAVFYILMARVLVKSYQKMPMDAKVTSTQAGRQMAARKKVAKVVLSFVLVFIICWLPRHVFLVWYHLLPGKYNMFWHVFKILSFCLCYVNSCVNPLALYFLSKKFQAYYDRYLFCCRPRKHAAATDMVVSESGTKYTFNSVKTDREMTVNTML